MSSEEKCPACGSTSFGVIRDMTSRRKCSCGEEWFPRKMLSFVDLEQELRDAPMTWIPALLTVIVEAAIRKKVFREDDPRPWVESVFSRFKMRGDG
jgi:hypothetical protein